MSVGAFEVAGLVLAIVGLFLDPEYFGVAVTLITVACVVFVVEGIRELPRVIGWLKLVGGIASWAFYMSIVFGNYNLLINGTASIGNYKPGTVRAGIPWKDEYSEFTMAVTNLSDRDYQNVHVTVKINQLSVAEVRQDKDDPSNTVSCDVVRQDDPGVTSPKTFIGRDSTGRIVQEAVPLLGTIGVPYLLMCASLPRHGTAHFVAAIRNGVNPYSNPPDVREPRPKKIVTDFCYDADFTVARRIRSFQRCHPASRR